MSTWTADDIPPQEGKTILITGANSGLGLRSAEALAQAGARVLLACRNPTKAAEALGTVQAKATGAAPEVVTLDLADLSSVETAAKDIADRTDRLDVLMNNAGVMAIPLARTVDGFEMQFGTNHLGHFALTGRLLPLLLQAKRPRVVTTSSQVHRIGRIRFEDPQWEHGYLKWLAYGQSKLANLLFAYELDRRAKAAGATLVSAAAHPGYASTHLQAAGPGRETNSVMGRLMDLGNQFFAQSDTMGALPQLYAATMPELEGGEYYGPGGAFEMQGHPKRVQSTSGSRDEDAAARLWTLSENATGITYEFG